MAYLYNPKEVYVALGGEPIIGFSSDTFIEMSLATPMATPRVGLDGRTSYSQSPNKGGNIILSLNQGSPSNTLLSTWSRLQRESSSFNIDDQFVLDQRVSLTVTDSSNSILLAGSGTVITEFPTNTLGSTASGKDRVWNFYCETMDFVEPEDPQQLQSLLRRGLRGIAGQFL